MQLERQLGSTLPQLLSNLLSAIPQGDFLDEVQRSTRFRAAFLLLCAHVPGITIFAVAQGAGPAHAASEGLIVGLFALGAVFFRRNHRAAGSITALGLVSSAALLVHLADGLSEIHFHYFLVLIVISLFEDWLPFALAVLFVLVEHAVMGVLDPEAVFGRGVSGGGVLQLSLLHGGYILASSIALVVNSNASRRAHASAAINQQELAVERARVVERQMALENERALREQLTQAQRLEAVAHLAAGVAHDFNNILGVISGFTGLAADSLAPEDPIREDLAEVEDASRRGTGLVRQLMMFSRQDVSQQEVVDIAAGIGEMEKMLRQAAGASIDIIISVDPAMPHVSFDPVQLQQILMNLVVNARDAIGGEGKIIIDGDCCRLAAGEIDELDAGSYARLVVSDTGSGMSEETLARVFDPFFTTKGKGKGTGLGLATVYGIVKEAGGHVAVASSPGAGTSFTILLPEAEGLSVHHQVVPLGSVTGRGETILLVEDDPNLAEVLNRFLSSGGYEVLWAKDGLAGLDMYRRRDRVIDLVVTDLEMPGMSGIEMAELLRIEEVPPRMIFMSGHPDEGESALRLEEERFLQKPFSQGDLLSEVGAVMRATVMA